MEAQRSAYGAAAACGAAAAGLALASVAGPAGVAPPVLRLGAVCLLAPAAALAWPRPRRRVQRAPVLVVAALAGIGAWVRVRELGLGPRYDETFGLVTFAERPLRVGLGHYPSPNNHLLDTLLTHVAWRLFGESLATMRMAALLAGVALVPAIFFAGRATYGAVAGAVAAALAAVSAPLVEYSVDGRGYTLAWLALALLVTLTARLVERPSIVDWTAWTVVSAMGLYALPILALALPSVLLWFAGCVAWRGRGRRAAEAAAATVATGALALWLYADVLHDPGWRFRASYPGSTEAFLRSLFATAHAGWGAPVRVAVVLAATVGLAAHRRAGRQPLPLALAAAAATPLVALALPHPPPYERAWLWLLPIWLLTVAAGVAHLLSRLPAWRSPPWRALAVAIALAGAATLGADDLPHGEDPPLLDGVAAARAAATLRPGAAVVVEPFTLPEMCFAARRAHVALSLRAGLPRPGPAVVVVSRSRRDTPALVAPLAGVRPGDLRLARRVGDVELYVPRGPERPTASARLWGRLSCRRLGFERS